MSKSILFTLAAVLSAAVLLVACNKDQDVEPKPKTETEAPAVVPTAPVELKDVIENDGRYIIGISYPPDASKYPGLAQAMRGYTDNARAELLKAVTAGDPAKQNGPYDLTINFTLLAETPEVVAVAGDGSSFTGGAHGTPLVVRFVWLPQQNVLLSSDNLFGDPRSWRAISDYTREQLHAALSQRVDADELPPDERADVMRSVGRMIDAGTEPVVASFAAFEPVPSSTALSIILSTVAAVSGEMTCVPTGASAGTAVPSGAVAGLMTCAGIRTPPFAIVAKTWVAWTALTETPWPNSTAYLVRPSHLSDGCRMPADSPASSRPVLAPKPNFAR